ncbi:CybS-domain-containing protein [Trichodelitschia bisporula]|uniref:Succinate dehydrogenase [ubiquinone] cytochrome b small subunit n=1 Tax=Trichodelitschia bisporula TaxID=703511 RepID=A0A6G1I0K3_9PEZI|nr:CybS-domain-containing protein [Trichodelitschia bisporula]
MASALRPTLIRQAFAAPAKQLLSRNASSLGPAARASLLPQVRAGLVRDALPASRAGFHATGAKAILTPLPETIQGTVNDPAPVPPPSPLHGSYHWTFERLLAVGLVPLTVAPFIGGSLNPAMDAVLCAALVIHSHTGFTSCITDYIPTWRMPKIRKACDWLLKFATVIAGVGLYSFETNDIGLTAAIARVWKA